MAKTHIQQSSYADAGKTRNFAQMTIHCLTVFRLVGEVAAFWLWTKLLLTKFSHFI